MLLEVCDVALQAQRFELAMRRNQQRSARGLIAAPGLDPDKPVLDEIDRPMAFRAPISFSNSTSDTGSSSCCSPNGNALREADAYLFFLSGASCGDPHNCHVVGSGAFSAS